MNDTLNIMKTNEGKVLSAGGWTTKRDCPDNPKKLAGGGAAHFMQDVSVKPSKTAAGRKAGERLITSRCKWCGGLIVDCPTFNIF